MPFICAGCAHSCYWDGAYFHPDGETIWCFDCWYELLKNTNLSAILLMRLDNAS